MCAAFYGHPGIFVYPGQEAMRRAHAEGLKARMLPGISSIDCLWCDLGIDPALDGCQIYHATEFVLQRRTADLHGQQPTVAIPFLKGGFTDGLEDRRGPRRGP